MKSLLSNLFIICLFPFGISAQTPLKEISLKDVMSNRDLRTQRMANLTSMKDGEHYMLQKSDSLVEYEYLTGNQSRIIFTLKNFIRKDKGDTLWPDDYEFSKDETKLLFSTETEPLYRRSSQANYYIMNFSNGEIKELSQGGKQRLADFSPDGSKVAFVRGNNLFIKDLVTGMEDQITSDGKPNNIINGATDWVYEEEFEFSKAFFWSPDGSTIAYYRFDESQVKEFSMTEWGALYPEEHKFKYPKAGEDNSLVNVFVYNLGSKATRKMDIGEETNIYIPRIKWTNDKNTLCIYRMNRLQNKLEFLFANPFTGASRLVYTEENKYYIEINDDLTFTGDNKFFLLTSEKSGYRHLYLYGMDGRFIRQLTQGKWEVANLLGLDEEKRIIYFTTTETSPMDRDLCAINLDGTRKKKLSKARGWNSASFSANYKYFVHTWQDINTPPVYTLLDAKAKPLRTLEDNARLKARTAEYGYAPAEFFTVTTPEGLSLNAYMIKPLNFDANHKYPVIMNVYGGPGSQSVENRWGGLDFIWYQMFAQKGYLSVCVDNRGTGARGEEFKKCTYLQLGKLETEDQVTTAKYLSTLPYIDGSRIGIWGWSYGGFMTALCLTRGADVFKAGVAVAPVTNWRYYDNIYTERFMRTPKENPDGYDDNSPTTFAKELKGKLLLVHGTGDDNVHFQNSIELTNALIKANKQFETFFYPNRNHGIYGGNTRMHLYQMMTDFWTTHL